MSKFITKLKNYVGISSFHRNISNSVGKPSNTAAKTYRPVTLTTDNHGMQNKKYNTKFHSTSNKKIIIVASLACIVLFTFSCIFYLRYRALQNKQPETVNSKLIKKVAKKTDIPKNETPTVAIIQDINKLQDQQFFKDAKNGDSLLIYNTAQKAVIYREQSDEVINVGPIQIVESEK